MGSCSSKKSGVSTSAGKEAVVSGERELRDTTQSSEDLKVSGLGASEAGDAVTDKKSGEVVASTSMDTKFSNKDDVVARDQDTSRVETRGEKADDHTTGIVGKDKEESSATRTDIKPSIPLQESSLVKTGTKVRKSVV